jgi:hypothetical protein
MDECKSHMSGFQVRLSGDHKIHTVVFPRDVWMEHDRDSIVWTAELGPDEAEHLFWELMRIIPELRKDRG